MPVLITLLVSLSHQYEDSIEDQIIACINEKKKSKSSRNMGKFISEINIIPIKVI